MFYVTCPQIDDTHRINHYQINADGQTNLQLLFTINNKAAVKVGKTISGAVRGSQPSYVLNCIQTYYIWPEAKAHGCATEMHRPSLMIQETRLSSGSDKIIMAFGIVRDTYISLLYF